MTPADWKIFLEIVHQAVESVAVMLGGCWALWRFVLQRDLYSRIEFSLDATLLGRFGDEVMLELAAIVTNRGAIRHKLDASTFTFSLHVLPEGAVLLLASEKKLNSQVLFPPALIEKRTWIPVEWEYGLVAAGASQRFTYVTKLPATAACVLLFSRFRYSDRSSEFHTAQKVFSIPKAAPAPPRPL
jgi:hypothetical protein